MVLTQNISNKKNRRKRLIDQIKLTAQACLPSDTEVFIFGSQANKEELITADIDIGLLSKEKIAYAYFSDFIMMLEALPAFFAYDVVDFNTVSDSFKKIALKNIEYIIR